MCTVARHEQIDDQSNSVTQARTGQARTKGNVIMMLTVVRNNLCKDKVRGVISVTRHVVWPEWSEQCEVSGVLLI